MERSVSEMARARAWWTGGRRMTRWTRTMCTVGLVGLCCLATAPAAWAEDVAPAAAAGPPGPGDSPGSGEPPVAIDYNSLLNGRYSFRFQGGESSEEGYLYAPFSAIGSVVFDGQGNVESIKYFLTKMGNTEREGRSTDSLQFVSGTYSVNNTEVGHVDLHFKYREVPSAGIQMKWDIALTNGGKGFYINVHSRAPDDSDYHYLWTANGQAAQE